MINFSPLKPDYRCMAHENQMNKQLNGLQYYSSNNQIFISSPGNCDNYVWLKEGCIYWTNCGLYFAVNYQNANVNHAVKDGHKTKACSSKKVIAFCNILVQ